MFGQIAIALASILVWEAACWLFREREARAERRWREVQADLQRQRVQR